MQATKITVTTKVSAPISKVWDYWTAPQHVQNWNNASDDWHCPKAQNDLKTGGKFCFTMAAKDGSVSFDFEGIYTDVNMNKRIAYTMSDGRQAEIDFKEEADAVLITETFDAETINSEELQRDGWQAILNNFKKYVEEN